MWPGREQPEVESLITEWTRLEVEQDQLPYPSAEWDARSDQRLALLSERLPKLAAADRAAAIADIVLSALTADETAIVDRQHRAAIIELTGTGWTLTEISEYTGRDEDQIR